MILRRVGNKSRIADKIWPLFTEHSIYIEPFFGGGGMFFNKPKARYNFLNDLDNDVYNLFMVLLERPDELRQILEIMPVHDTLLQTWRKNRPSDPVQNAAAFLLESNFTFLGKGETLKTGTENSRRVLLDNLQPTINALLEDCFFHNKDFEPFLKSISLKEDEKAKSFIYVDPPYLQTVDNYSNSFTEADVVRLFDALQAMQVNFGYSEFAHPFILDQADERGLTVNTIGERQSLKNRSTEILVTNYQKQRTLFCD
jgi:DNA adenine methylase